MKHISIFSLAFLSMKLIIFLPSTLLNKTKPTLADLKELKINESKLKIIIKRKMEDYLIEETKKLENAIKNVLSNLTVENFYGTNLLIFKNEQQGQLSLSTVKEQINSILNISRFFNCYSDRLIKYIKNMFDSDLKRKEKKYLLEEHKYNFVYDNIIRLIKTNIENLKKTCNYELLCKNQPILMELRSLTVSGNIRVSTLYSAFANLIIPNQKTPVTSNAIIDDLPKNNAELETKKTAIENKLTELITEVLDFYDQYLDKICEVMDYITFANTFYYATCNLFKKERTITIIKRDTIKRQNKILWEDDIKKLSLLENLIKENEEIIAYLNIKHKPKILEDYGITFWIYSVICVVSTCMGGFLFGLLIGLKNK